MLLSGYMCRSALQLFLLSGKAQPYSVCVLAIVLYLQHRAATNWGWLSGVCGIAHTISER